MELIDKNILLEQMKRRKDYIGRASDPVCLVEDAPAVDATPVVHGTWIEKLHYDNEDNCIQEWQSAKCDKCGLYHTTPYSYYFEKYKYCPNCGAKMDRERLENDG
jgi:hypothetical protein